MKISKIPTSRHCEECNDVAIRDGVPPLHGLPRFARNDETGTFAISHSLTGRVPVRTALLAAFLVAAVAYAAWDYQRVSQIYLVPGMRSPTYRDNTLEKIQKSWLFQDQVHFAELTTTALTPENALHINQLAHAMLHFSPEPSVVEKLIESATLLGRGDEALFYLTRYQAAFPESQARWAASIATPLPTAMPASRLKANSFP